MKTELEIIEFDIKDIITTSTGFTEGDKDNQGGTAGGGGMTNING